MQPEKAITTITAHTGCEKTKKDSLESVIKGIEAGANIVEFDVRFRKGEPIISHNEIKDNKAYVTFEQMLIEVKKHNDIEINIDLKEKNKHLAVVQQLVEKHNLLERVFFTGVEIEEVDTVKKFAPKCRYYINLVTFDKNNFADESYLTMLIEQAKKSGAIGVNLSKKWYTKSLRDIAQGQHLLVSVWTVNSKRHMTKVLNIIPDNITTKKPTKLKCMMN